LDISWEKGATQITIEETHSVWEAVLSPVPSWLLESSPGKVIVLRGETKLPVVWRFFSAMDRSDFENILKVALSREAVDFMTHFERRGKLFLKLAGLMLLFFWRCVVVWLTRKGKRGKKGSVATPA
jgi:hypothetical protein